MGWGSKPNASRGSKPNAQCQVLFYDRGSKPNANVPKTWQAWHFGEGRNRTQGGQNRSRGPFLVAGAGLWLCHLQRNGSILFYLLCICDRRGIVGGSNPNAGGQRRMCGPFLVAGAALHGSVILERVETECWGVSAECVVHASWQAQNCSRCPLVFCCVYRSLAKTLCLSPSLSLKVCVGATVLCLSFKPSPTPVLTLNPSPAPV